MKNTITQILFIILLCINVYSQEFFTDVIVTSSNGIWTDSRAYSTLNDAIASVGINERTIIIANKQIVGDLDIPSNITLSFNRDGSIANSGTLNINTKNIIASDRQIFTGSGSINFTNGTVLRSSWFEDLPEAIGQTNGYYDYLTLVISEESIIDENVTVGDKTVLKWESPRNRITINSGFTLSGVKNIEAGEYQIFTGSGDIDFLDGTILNLTWFKRLRAVVDWVENEEVTLSITKPFTMDYDNIIPSNMHLIMHKGAIISGFNNLTINGTVQADRYKIFENSLNVTGLSSVYPEWWGAVPNGLIDCLASFNSANDSLTLGGDISLGVGTYILSDTFEISDKVKLRGINSSTSEIKAQANANITGGLITNKVKGPVGQEFIYIQDLLIDGNRYNNATVDALIYLENTYVNSHLKNLVLNYSSGHCIWYRRTVGFGPVYAENCWLTNSGNDLLFIEGGEGLVFFNCSFENVDANKNCIHLTGDPNGSRSQVLFTMAHFEYSNEGVIAVYADKTSMTLIMPEFQGNQKASQYNVYIANDAPLKAVDYYISNPQQASVIRHGIYIADIDEEYTENYGLTGILTNATPRFTRGFDKVIFGDFPAGGDREFTDGDTTPSVRGSSVWRTNNTSPTTITRFDNVEEGQIFIVYFNDDNTRLDFNNARLRLAGKFFNARKEDMMMFISKGGITWELSRSKNIDSPLSIADGNPIPVIDGISALSIDNPNPTSITRFLRLPRPETPIIIRFTTSNTTLIDGTYIKLSGGSNYNPPAETMMLFFAGGETIYEISRTNY